jgi:hypothetical protein
MVNLLRIRWLLDDWIVGLEELSRTVCDFMNRRMGERTSCLGQ